MQLHPEHREFSRTDPNMKLSIFAIVLFGAVLAIGNANPDVEPEERVADLMERVADLMDTIKNRINTVRNGLDLGGRADMEPEERNGCGMLRCGPPTKWFSTASFPKTSVTTVTLKYVELFILCYIPIMS